jgi:hypothetical protein
MNETPTSAAIGSTVAVSSRTLNRHAHGGRVYLGDERGFDERLLQELQPG